MLLAEIVSKINPHANDTTDTNINPTANIAEGTLLIKLVKINSTITGTPTNNPKINETRLINPKKSKGL